MKSLLRSVLILPLAAFALLTGCADKGPAPRKISIRAVEASGSLPMPAEDHALFTKSLDLALYDEAFIRGNELTLEWKITRYDRGNRALRYLVGFGAGKAHVWAEGRLVDSKKKIINLERAKGSEAFGLFGGSADNAVEESGLNLGYNAAYAAYPEEE